MRIARAVFGAAVAIASAIPIVAAADAAPRRSCLAAIQTRECAVDPGLGLANDVVISPDGRHLYTAGNDGSVLAFRFGERLVRVLGPKGCLSRYRVPDCAPLRGVWDAMRLSLAPDGRTLYVTSPERSPAQSETVAVLRRDPRTGWLKQLAGRAGCVNDAGAEGCARAAMDSPFGVAPSPDGRHVYVTNAPFGTLRPTHLNVFARVRRTGGLRAVQTVPSFESIDVAVSPDGRHVYLVSDQLRGFRRDAASGRLRSSSKPRACGAGRGCPPPRALWEPAEVAVSDDGRTVVTVSAFNHVRGIAAFRRDPRTGALRQLPGAAGCAVTPFSADDDLGPDAESAASCARIDALGPVAVARDAAFVLAGRRLLRLGLRDGALLQGTCALDNCAAPAQPGPAGSLAADPAKRTFAVTGWIGASVPTLALVRGAPP